MIRAFARFVVNRDPAHAEWRGQMRVFASRKSTSKLLDWLIIYETHALLDVPDRATRHSRTEREFKLESGREQFYSGGMSGSGGSACRMATCGHISRDARSIGLLPDFPKSRRGVRHDRSRLGPCGYSCRFPAPIPSI